MFFYFLVSCSWSRAALFMPSLYANKFVRFERTIWPSIEFKKSLDIFWSRLERRRSEEYLDHFDLQVEDSRVTSRLEFILKNSNWNTATICEVFILGDPGTVSRAGLKGATKVFKHGEEETLDTDSHRNISKRSRECCFLIRQKKCFVLLCPIGEQFLQSCFREFVHDGYYPDTVAQFVHQAFLTRNEGTTDESKNVSDANQQEQLNLHWENSVSDGSQCIVNNRKFKMRRRRESKKSNSLTRQNNNFARASRFFVYFFAVTARLPRENA